MNKKRLFTKAVSWLLTFVMLVSLVPQTSRAVQAAEDETYSVTLYFELPTDTTVSDWGINAWSDVEITAANWDEMVSPAGWGSSCPSLLSKDGLDGWGYVTLKGKIDGIQFVDASAQEYRCWNAQIATDGLTEAYFDSSAGKWYKESTKETEIAEAQVRDIFVLAGDEKLTGSNWSITDENNFLTQNEGADTYSITYKNVVPGSYEYKIVQDPENYGWEFPCGEATTSTNCKVEVTTLANVTFTVNAAAVKENIGVDIKPVEGLILESVNLKRGESIPLVTDAKYYDGTGSEPEDVTVTYELKTSTEGITLEGNTITVADTVEAKTVTVVATYENYSTEFTLPIVDKEYTVHINMYSQDLEMSPGVSDIYIYNADGTENTVLELTGTYEDEENGVIWVTGTIKLPYNALGIIARDVAGSWDGGQESNGRYYTIDEDETEVTLWYEYGVGITTEKPTVTKTEQRYFYLDYENKNFEEGEVPQFYSWTTGYAAECIGFEDNGDGSYSIQVPVKSTCTKVDFVIVYDASAEPWTKDGGDHSVSFPLEQRVVFATMKEGQEPELGAPYNVGYDLQPENDQISFYYRDDAALIEGTLADLKPKVEINGTEYDMAWNEADKRFVYNKTGLENGRMYYRYNVGDEYVLDKFNDNTETKDDIEYSYVEYYKLNAEVNATVKNTSFNYNENNLVKLEVEQDEKDVKELEVSKATIDVSSLGGSDSMPIEPELMAVTISVTTDTELGEKTLPIVVTDQYSNTYETNVKVTVVERVKEENDFDWDESCIYFMVTDRFFDGNEENNTASDQFLPEGSTVKTTYGKDDDGLYHGGDFAGVTAKLDYLEDLGINTIWITPIVENIPGVAVTGEGSDDVPYNAAYHGYWASDFTKLNPTLGTEEEFETMIEEAHSRGIKIMVDIVVNHAGYDTEDTFGDMLRSGDDVVVGDDQKDGLSNLPDFRTEDATVRKQLVEWQTSWMKDYGIDYYRVDTVKHVEGTTWAALKNSTTEVNPSFKMIGEYSGAGYASNGGTLGTGQMDSDLDFDFNDQATNFVKGNISDVEAFMAARNEKLNNTYLTGQFLGSHDEIGFKQNLLEGGMAEDQAEAAALVAATLQITAKGQPVIYYGEELGQTGENIYPYQTNRYDLDWSKATDDNITYQHYKKLLAARNAYVDVFARGDRSVVAGGDEAKYDIIKRTYGTDTLFVGMNLNDKEQTVTLSDCGANATYTDVYAGKLYLADNEGKITITLPKSSDGGTFILAKNQEKEENTPTPTATAQPTDTPSDAPATPTAPASSDEPATPTPTAPVDQANNTPLPPATQPTANIQATPEPPVATATTSTTTVKKVTIKSVTNKKTKKMVIKWKKLSGVNGYQIQYSTTKKFKTKKSINITKAATNKYTVKKLKKKKTYYVRIRAFKKVDGKKVYGSYSAVKKVKIKK